MIQYASSLPGGAKYQKIQPNIDGFGSKDNQDMVFHTSQSAAGTTLEAMRLDTNGRLFLGFTQGNTLGGGGVGTHTHFWSKSRNSKDSLILVQNASDSGQSGAYFGCHQQHVRFWNYGLSGNAGTDSMTSGTRESSRAYEFWFGGLAGEPNRRIFRLNDTHCIVGTKTYSTAGASLDVADGGIVAAGDIFTEGGTYGVFASVLGVTATLGGYNLPVTAGVSGEVMMVHGTGKTLGFFALPRGTQWSGTEAKGISFAANVGVATGGVNDFYGATLEVGGGAIIHGGLTIGYPLHIGNVTGHADGGNYPFSVRGVGRQYLNVRSNDESTALVMDAYDGKDNQIWMKENGSDKAKIVWDGSQDQLEMQFYNSSALKWEEAFQMNSNGRLGLGTGGAIDNDYMVTIGEADSDYRVGGLLVKTPINLFSPDSHGTGGHVNAPLQIQKDGGAYLQVGASHFGSNEGTFIGEGSAGTSQIWSMASGAGGTLDLIVANNSSGNTMAARIHNSGTVEILGGGGLKVTDYTGSNGNSGDVLVSADGTGMVAWSGPIGSYGKSCVSASGSAFFAAAASGSSTKIVADSSSDETYYYQENASIGHNKPIFVTIHISDSSGGTNKQITYTAPDGSTAVVAQYKKTGGGGHGNYFTYSWHMVPGSSFTIDANLNMTDGNGNGSCHVLKQE